MSSLGGSYGPERDSDPLLVTHQAPKSLSQAASVSAGHLASGGGVCCSHLPSSALPILISTSGLPLLDLPWRPLWIFPRQTFLYGLSAQVQSPREWGTPGTILGSKGSHQNPGCHGLRARGWKGAGISHRAMGNGEGSARVLAVPDELQWAGEGPEAAVLLPGTD